MYAEAEEGTTLVTGFLLGFSIFGGTLRLGLETETETETETEDEDKP